VEDRRQVIDDVYKQLDLMAANPKSWHRFRVLEMYCGSCDEPIAQVMRTTHGLAVVYRSFRGTTARPASVTGRRYESQAMSKPIARMLHDGPFVCFCACTRTVLEERDFTDPISKGQARIIRRRSATRANK
jgi:hypothetical protein